MHRGWLRPCRDEARGPQSRASRAPCGGGKLPRGGSSLKSHQVPAGSQAASCGLRERELPVLSPDAVSRQAGRTSSAASNLPQPPMETCWQEGLSSSQERGGGPSLPTQFSQKTGNF